MGSRGLTALLQLYRHRSRFHTQIDVLLQDGEGSISGAGASFRVSGKLQDMEDTIGLGWGIPVSGNNKKSRPPPPL